MARRRRRCWRARRTALVLLAVAAIVAFGRLLRRCRRWRPAAR